MFLLLERDEAGGVGGADTGTSVLHGSVLKGDLWVGVRSEN